MLMWYQVIQCPQNWDQYLPLSAVLRENAQSLGSICPMSKQKNYNVFESWWGWASLQKDTAYINVYHLGWQLWKVRQQDSSIVIKVLKIHLISCGRKIFKNIIQYLAINVAILTLSYWVLSFRGTGYWKTEN